MITLHDYILSGDCYKIRLLLAMLGLKYDVSKVDVHPGRDNETPRFLALSPLGRIPVLQEDDLVLWDANAILTYLALRYDSARAWLPADAAHHAAVAVWLGFAATELDGILRLRMSAITSAAGDVTEPLAQAYRTLTVLEDHLAEGEIRGAKWLVGDGPTIADIATFPPVALAPDASISLDRFPAIWRWLDRVKRLDGFIVMPGVMPNLSDAV
ncbi:glutathione S-transferase family protein [Beijerinckia sp. L45]|uniref:glutathione S-transferase family protein n=1 Tax=Beijerinckia sp. L45 TaxID=1641855 RepID=UPI00131D921B|nr:glutathione S-transferase family protein [Beijerinckia sp. L45]